MGRRCVEGVEVVPAEFRLGPLRHPVAKADEYLANLVGGLLDQVFGPGGKVHASRVTSTLSPCSRRSASSTEQLGSGGWP